MANSQKSVLVTGGIGFLGSHLCEYFLRKQYKVVAVDNLCTALPSNLEFLRSLGQKQFHFVEQDVSTPWSQWCSNIPPEYLENLEYVFHFASPASPPLYQELALETMEVNSAGLKYALKWADQHKARCIFASTSEVYGDPEVHPQTEAYRGSVNTTGPRSCYDEAKRFGEALLFTHNWKNQTQHGMVRIFNTYGPRMNPSDGRVVINLLTQARDNKALTIYGDGKQTRSFCYVDDLIKGITMYADSLECGPINIGNSDEFTILELATAIQSLYPERKFKVRHLEFPKDDPLQRRPDLSIAAEKLNWKPEVSLKDGLEKLNGWLNQLEPK